MALLDPSCVSETLHIRTIHTEGFTRNNCTTEWNYWHPDPLKMLRVTWSILSRNSPLLCEAYLFPPRKGRLFSSKLLLRKGEARRGGAHTPML